MKSFTYFDAHSHIHFADYDTDRDAVYARMQEEGVGALAVGTDAATSRSALKTAEEYDDIWATVGMHPTDVLHATFDKKLFTEFAKHPKNVGIGECGLDYHHTEKSEDVLAKQKRMFEQHIEIALAVDKPLMIHCRPRPGSMDAYEDVLAILEEHHKTAGEKLRGNIHFFVGSKELARRFLELGFTLSFTGVITFARDYDEVVRFAPLDRILSETDCPFVSPEPYRGRRNEPAYVRFTAQKIAEIRGEDEEKVLPALVRNVERVFALEN